MKTICSLLSMTLIITLIGCGTPELSAVDPAAPDSSAEKCKHEHDDHHHDEASHPESYDEAVKQIKEMGGKITDAFASGKPDDAHDELHEIGQVIECLPDLAKRAELSSEHQVRLGKVTEALMDAFEELDGTLHGGNTVDADDISRRVSTQIDKLQSLRK